MKLPLISKLVLATNMKGTMKPASPMRTANHPLSHQFDSASDEVTNTAAQTGGVMAPRQEK